MIEDFGSPPYYYDWAGEPSHCEQLRLPYLSSILAYLSAGHSDQYSNHYGDDEFSTFDT